jgi:hypothetical protein
MYYQSSIITPANTPESNALDTELVITLGTIHNVLVGFPPGPQGLLHCRILDKGWSLVPWTLGESIAFDNFVYNLIFDYPVVVEPFRLSILTWNLDTNYSHALWVGVSMSEGTPDTSLLDFIKSLQKVA